MKLLGGRKVLLSVQGLQGRPVACYYGILPDGTAVMEMAACAGLPLLDGALDPMHTTTYGVGEMLLACRAQRGAPGAAWHWRQRHGRLRVGMAAALGYRFLNKDGAAVEAVTCHMAEIAAIVPPARKPALDIIAACDVDNPLCGETGAIYTFGKQKGISEEMMPEMDARMKHFAQVLTRHTGVEVLDVPGAGAAGGMGAALLAFLHAKLQPGVELLLDAVGFDSLLQQTDIVFTGEGRIDWQSARGKVPVGVARRAQAAGRAVHCAVRFCWRGCGTGVSARHYSGFQRHWGSVRLCPGEKELCARPAAFKRFCHALAGRREHGAKLETGRPSGAGPEACRQRLSGKMGATGRIWLHAAGRNIPAR